MKKKKITIKNWNVLIYGKREIMPEIRWCDKIYKSLILKSYPNRLQWHPQLSNVSSPLPTELVEYRIENLKSNFKF